MGRPRPSVACADQVVSEHPLLKRGLGKDDVVFATHGSWPVRSGISLCASAQVADRIVSELCHMPPETPVKYCRLRGHVDADRCCGKSLMGTALVGVAARCYA